MDGSTDKGGHAGYISHIYLVMNLHNKNGSLRSTPQTRVPKQEKVFVGTSLGQDSVLVALGGQLPAAGAFEHRRHCLRLCPALFNSSRKISIIYMGNFHDVLSPLCLKL